MAPGSKCLLPQSRPVRGPASARNTDFLQFQSAKNVINGVAFAASVGTPVTVSLTLHWDLFQHYDTDDPIRSQGKLVNRCTNWLADRGIPIRYVWVRENGVYKRQHLHWLLHLPVRHWRDFRAFLTQAGGCYRSPGRTDAPFKMSGGKWGMWKPTMWAGETRYILKSLCPTARSDGRLIMDALGIRHKRSLPLQGMRAGVSRSLNKTTRSRAGWRELDTLDQLHAVLNPCAYH
jgi:hypothetical protein